MSELCLFIGPRLAVATSGVRLLDMRTVVFYTSFMCCISVAVFAQREATDSLGRRTGDDTKGDRYLGR